MYLSRDLLCQWRIRPEICQYGTMHRLSKTVKHTDEPRVDILAKDFFLGVGAKPILQNFPKSHKRKKETLLDVCLTKVNYALQHY